MTDWKKMERIASASQGKTIERMEIGAARVELEFTDGSSVEIDFSHDEAYGFSVEVEEKA